MKFGGDNPPIMKASTKIHEKFIHLLTNWTVLLLKVRTVLLFTGRGYSYILIYKDILYTDAVTRKTQVFHQGRGEGEEDLISSCNSSSSQGINCRTSTIELHSN